MKKIMWLISFIALGGTAIAIQFMPESIPMHRDFAGNIDRYGSRYESFLMVIVILAFSLFWTLLIRYFEKKAIKLEDEKERSGAKTNAKVLSIVGLATTVFFTIMQGVSLHRAYSDTAGDVNSSVDPTKVSVIVMGVMFIVFGNYLTKTRNNSIIGVRTTWSMYNDITWKKSNFFGAIALIVVGVINIVTGALIRNSMVAIFLELGYLLVAVVAIMIYSYKAYITEKNKV